MRYAWRRLRVRRRPAAVEQRQIEMAEAARRRGYEGVVPEMFDPDEPWPEAELGPRPSRPEDLRGPQAGL